MNNSRALSRGNLPRVNTKSFDQIKAAKKQQAKSVRQFWREYFGQYPDCEGNAQMNRLREHFAEGGT